MLALHQTEFAAVTGGHVAPLSRPDLVPQADQWAIEDFLAWCFQRALLH